MSTTQHTLDSYQRQRDALVELLGEGTALLDQHGQTIPSWKVRAIQFRDKQRKLKSDQFTIALLAEMQSGKSSIFNSVAGGGRELSPVGSFIRTSGCPVYGSDLGDPDAKEYALIDWRSDDELVAGFDQLSLGTVNLGSAADVERLKDAAEKKLNEWKKDPASFDPAGTGLLDVVRIARLVAQFCQQAELQALKARFEFEVAEVGRYVRYPEDWETRWQNGLAERFQWDEVAFIFVRRVHYFLHAPRLAKIGCTLVDCPGLFASRYDRDVAFSTIKDADAILYLTPGDKAITQSQLTVLRQIRDGKQEAGLPRMEHKLFFAWNMKTSRMNAEGILLPHLKASLCSDGFTIATGDYFLIHAALALAADQARMLLEWRLDARTREAIARRCKIPIQEVESRIWENLNEWRRNLTGNQRLPFQEDMAIATEAEQLGEVDTFIGKAQEFVVRHGPLAILVQNGSEIVAGSLKEVEVELEQKEQRAQTKLEEHRVKANAAETALRQFESEAGEVLERLGEEGPDLQLADDFLNHVDGNLRDEIAGEIAGRLEPELGFWNVLKHGWQKVQNACGNLIQGLVFRDPFAWPNNDAVRWWTAPVETSLERTVRQICSDVFASRLQKRHLRWQAGIEEGTNPVFNREIGARVERVNSDIQQRWQKHVLEGIPLLQGVQPPRLSPRLKEAVEFARVAALTDAAVETELSRVGTGAALAAGGALAAAVALATGKTAVTFLGATLFSSTQPWMWPVVAVGVLATLFGVQKLFSREKLKDQVADALAVKWDGLRDGLRLQIKQIGHGIRAFYRSQFEKNVIPHPRARFVERKAAADEEFNKSQEERNKLAAEARRLRQEQFEPLRRRLEAFSAECRKEFGTAPTQPG